MARAKTASVRQHGTELTIQQHQTDFPVVPVEAIERLHQIRPDAVDWILKQTESEAAHRRVIENAECAQSQQVNKFVFANLTVGQICALIIGLAGIFSGAYVAVNDQPWAGAVIASFAITGLAVVFLTSRKK